MNVTIEQFVALASTLADVRLNLDQREAVIAQQQAVIAQQADRITELESTFGAADHAETDTP